MALTPLSLSVKWGIMVNWSREVYQQSLGLWPQNRGWKNHRSLFSVHPRTVDWPLQEPFTLPSNLGTEYSLSYVSFSIWASVYVCTVREQGEVGIEGTELSTYVTLMTLTQTCC